MDKNTLFSSFGKWVSPIFSKRFYQDLASSDQDKYVKKLTTPAYLLLFLHAQLQQREGLRAIADDALGKLFQRELGFTSISPSQLKRRSAGKRSATCIDDGAATTFAIPRDSSWSGQSTLPLRT